MLMPKDRQPWFSAFLAWGVDKLVKIAEDPKTIALVKTLLIQSRLFGRDMPEAQAEVDAIFGSGEIGGRSIKAFFDTSGRLILYSDTDEPQMSAAELDRFCNFRYTVLPRIDNRAAGIPVMRSYHIGLRFDSPPATS